MSKSAKIVAEKRDVNLNPRQVRSLGLITATIYGKSIDPVSIQLGAKNFISKYKANKDDIYNIVVNKDSYETKVTSVQKDYSTGKKLNIEFMLIAK